MHEFSPEKPNKKPQKNLGKPIAIGVIALVALGASFFGGVQFQKGKTPAGNTALTNGQMQMGGGQMSGRPQVMIRGGVFGEVTAISSTSITVKGDDGASTTLTINDSTAFRDGEATATIDAIQTGDRVIATKDTSDSTVAKQITVNPTLPGPQGAQGTSDQSINSDTPTTYTN